MVHVCNVPSPAATASLATGKYIVDTAIHRMNQLKIVTNANYRALAGHTRTVVGSFFELLSRDRVKDLDDIVLIGFGHLMEQRENECGIGYEIRFWQSSFPLL